jgi:hypothetical protein
VSRRRIFGLYFPIVCETPIVPPYTSRSELE